MNGMGIDFRLITSHRPMNRIKSQPDFQVQVSFFSIESNDAPEMAASLAKASANHKAKEFNAGFHNVCPVTRRFHHPQKCCLFSDRVQLMCLFKRTTAPEQIPVKSNLPYVIAKRSGLRMAAASGCFSA